MDKELNPLFIDLFVTIKPFAQLMKIVLFYSLI
jgi:hypothetical protein